MSNQAINEPLKLFDGTLVYPNGRIERPKQTSQSLVEVPTHSEARDIVVRTRRQLIDLPAVPKTMNIINAVLMYEFFGLTRDEIAVALNVTVAQIATLQGHPAYAKMREQVIDNIMEADTDNVRAMFQQHAKTATRKIVDLMENGNQAARLAASRDILDRAGLRPVDVVEHRHTLDGALRIEYVTETVAPAVTIEMEMPT